MELPIPILIPAMYDRPRTNLVTDKVYEEALADRDHMDTVHFCENGDGCRPVVDRSLYYTREIGNRKEVLRVRACRKCRGVLESEWKDVVKRFLEKDVTDELQRLYESAFGDSKSESKADKPLSEADRPKSDLDEFDALLEGLAL